MKTIIKSSAFDRAMKVEAELNRLHGRIIKQIDSIKSYESSLLSLASLYPLPGPAPALCQCRCPALPVPLQASSVLPYVPAYQHRKPPPLPGLCIDDETEEIIDDLMDGD